MQKNIDHNKKVLFHPLASNNIIQNVILSAVISSILFILYEYLTLPYAIDISHALGSNIFIIKIVSDILGSGFVLFIIFRLLESYQTGEVVTLLFRIEQKKVTMFRCLYISLLVLILLFQYVDFFLPITKPSGLTSIRVSLLENNEPLSVKVYQNKKYVGETNDGVLSVQEPLIRGGEIEIIGVHNSGSYYYSTIIKNSTVYALDIKIPSDYLDTVLFNIMSYGSNISQSGQIVQNNNSWGVINGVTRVPRSELKSGVIQFTFINSSGIYSDYQILNESTLQKIGLYNWYTNLSKT